MTGAPKYGMELPPTGVVPTPRWIRVRSGDRWIADGHDTSSSLTTNTST